MRKTNYIPIHYISCLILALCSLSSGLHAQTLSQKGDAAFDERNYRMAVVHYQRALRHYPGDAELLNALAKSYDKRRELAKARDAASRAVEIDNEQVDSLLILGRLEKKEGELDNALSFYNQVLSVEVDNKVAQTGLIETYQAAGMLEAAKSAMEQFEK